jgi:hypothetical protein
MLKLKTLITEQEFKAKSKETGRVVVYKSKDSMDKAIKGGKAEPLDKKTSGKPKGFGLFKKKDFGKDKTRGAAKGRPATTVVDRGDGKLTNVFGKGIESVDDLKQMTSKIEGRVDLIIDDANISDEFNDSLYIQDGKLMFTDVFGDEEEITDEETLEALKDVIKDEDGLVVQKTKFEKGDKIKSKTSFHFAKDVKKIKGSYDLGGVTIKDGKMFNADGEEMDEDDIEDFYYQEATDEKGNEVGVEVFKKLEEQLKKSLDLLNEAQVWERKFGEPLPTFSSVMEKHSGEKIDEQGVLSRRAGINVFGDRKLQLMAKGLRQSAFDLEKVAKRKDEQAFDDILQRITITIGVIRSFLNKPKRSM